MSSKQIPDHPIAQAFDALKVCVIIPTYNNATTIGSVLGDVGRYTRNIIVVNDGSTDSTEQIINAIEGVEQISYLPNKGKGMALRRGFQRAIALGFEHAITIDSDGQHFARDLPRFIDSLRAEGPALVMGARNMDSAENVPGKSSFGNRFSNFWFKVETGLELPDTQTGFRLYPLDPIGKRKWFTRKYEFEIEVIVRLAWSGLPVRSVPITVYYPPPEARISHFRPFKDFSRISVLNTVLVTLCFFYIWPRNFFRRFYRNKNWKTSLKQMLLKPGETDLIKSNSMAFGGFMGIVPIWGFQLIVAIALSHVFKLNKALVVLAAHVSIAPMIPLIVFLSYKMGKPFMGSRAVDLSWDKGLTLSKIGQNLEQYIYGSLFLALLTGLLLWTMTFLFLKLRRRVKR